MSATTPESGAADLLDGTFHGRPRSILREMVLAILRPLLSLRLIGVEHVPDDGPLLVVSNHLSNADPIILERPFRGRSFSWASPSFSQSPLPLDPAPLRRLPVERGTADRAAIRRAGGSRTRDRPGDLPGGRSVKDRRTRHGITRRWPDRAAIRCAGASGGDLRYRVLPGQRRFATTSSQRSPRGVTVHFGTRFAFRSALTKRVTAEEATRLIMVRIAELLPERYHGVYGTDELAGNGSPRAATVRIRRAGARLPLPRRLGSSGCSSSWSPQTSSTSAMWTTSPSSIPTSQLVRDPTRFQEALKTLDPLVP